MPRRDPTAPRRTRSAFARLAQRAAVLAGAGALALGAAEAFARTADPFGISYYRDTNRYFNEAILLSPDAARPDGRLFENARDVDLGLRTFRFRTNEHGLRRGAHASPRAAQGRCVLFLGDSVTLAWGVDDSSSWVRCVEREGRALDGSALVCANAGHLQYNTTQEADWFLTHVDEIRPEIVVLTVVINDLDDAWATYTELMDALANRPSPDELSLAEGLRGRLPIWFRGLHALANLRSELRGARSAEDRSHERVQDQPGYAAGWSRCATALERIRAECQRRGIPFVVFDHTIPRIAAVETWCEAAGVPWYEFSFTPAEWAQDVRNSLADAHANELGNRLLARKALAALRAEGLLARASKEEPPR